MARKSQRIRRQRRIERMKAREQEAKLTQKIEDNSAILERMKIMSSTIDEVVQKIEAPTETKATLATPPVVQMKAEPLVNMRAEPVVEMKEEPSVEITIQPFNEPTLIAPKKTLNFKKMTKRNLLSYAKKNNIDLFMAFIICVLVIVGRTSMLFFFA